MMWCLVTSLVLLPVCLALQDNQRYGRSGVVKPCDSGKHDVNGTFSPVVIKQTTTLKFNYSFIFRSRVASGTVRQQLFVPGVPDPIYRQNYAYNCSLIKKYFKVCPVPSHKLFTGSGSGPLTLPSGIENLPSGSYIMQLDLRNEEGEQVSCVKAQFILQTGKSVPNRKLNTNRTVGVERLLYQRGRRHDNNDV